MSGYRATQIRIPEDEKEFEKNCVILFQAYLNDPNAYRLGTRGQKQDGVDIVGQRDSNPDRVVGIQCKLKSGRARLTRAEVMTEVTMALNFRPPLTEYFIVATSKSDTKLSQLALELSRKQKELGRIISISVWGWDTLADEIDKYPSAKNAFDPGFSPALKEQNSKLDLLMEGQQRLIHEANCLPQAFSDRVLRDELSTALRRIGFGNVDTPAELQTLATRAAEGDLRLATASLRADVCERAARASAVAETKEIAVRYREHVRRLEPERDLAVLDALILDANGDPAGALRALRGRADGPSNSASLAVIRRYKGVDRLWEWITDEGLTASDFSETGAFNLVMALIQCEKFNEAFQAIKTLPARFFEELPVLRLLRAQLVLADTLPLGRKSAVFDGLQINPRSLQFPDTAKAADAKKAAVVDFEALVREAGVLGIGNLRDYFAENLLWLQLEIAELRDRAYSQLTAEISDPALTLKRVRLGLAYHVDFNADALMRKLLRQQELAGWNPDERFAALLLIIYKDDPKTSCEFVEAHRDDLFTQDEITHGFIASLLVDSLAKLGRFEEARKYLLEFSGRYLDESQSARAFDEILALERGNPLEQHRQQYEKSGALSDLQLLVSDLHGKKDYELLAEYAPRLARITLTVGDFDLAIKSLYKVQRDAELVALADDLHELTAMDLDYRGFRAWALYRLGKLIDARKAVRLLLRMRNDPADRELAINTAIETGDWGNLHAVLASAVEQIDTLKPRDCMRYAKIAMEIDSSYVDRFRDAALRMAPEDPEINLSAYLIATHRGEEDRSRQARDWFAKAVTLSGETGPVSRVSFKDAIDMQAGWQERVQHFDALLRRGQMPLFMVSRGVGRQVIDLTFGQALYNSTKLPSYPVMAFSGARTICDIQPSDIVAVDLTALITLTFLGVLEKTIASIERLVISPRTLNFLFGERQFIRVQQPSLVRKAKRIQALLNSGHLKMMPVSEPINTDLGKEIGRELTVMLEEARNRGAVVVRSSPVARVGSYLDETVELMDWQRNLADTHEVVKFLEGKGRLNALTVADAKTYLAVVDEGWDSGAEISGKTAVYLDDLALSYLDHAGILSALTEAADSVFVYADSVERNRQVLEHADRADELVSAIEMIRSAVSGGIENGRIAFSSRRPLGEKEGDEFEDPLESSPTLDLLCDLRGIDVIVSDDRSMNHHPEWLDNNNRSARSACTLDILNALRGWGQLSENEFWLARHKLRTGGFYAVPVDGDELVQWLSKAVVGAGELRETPELKAIRESLLLPLIRESFVPQEEAWLDTVRLAVFQSIRQIWTSSLPLETTRVYSEWLFAIAPNPLEWCLDEENDIAWERARLKWITQIAPYLVFVAERRQEYFDWLTEAVIEPIQVGSPEDWAEIVDDFKGYLKRLLLAANAKKI